jgi:transcriptional regulator with XRE-family HTH domain
MSQSISGTIKRGVLLRALRNAFGLSQTELASSANCSRPTINRIENFENSSPRSDTVDDLMKVFADFGVEVINEDAQVTIKFTEKALIILQRQSEKCI